VATLQLYDLCSPAKDATITRQNLEMVLQQHIGTPLEVAKVLNLMGSGDSQGDLAERFDFLSYWQGIDRFFLQAGGGHCREGDMISGMRRFRDGVLEAQRAGTDSALSSQSLLALLTEIRASANDPGYWDEVMQAVPSGGSLTLSEIAEAVCVWLRDCAKPSSESAKEGFGQSDEEGEDGSRSQLGAQQRLHQQGADLVKRLSCMSTAVGNRGRPSSANHLMPLSAEVRRASRHPRRLGSPSPEPLLTPSSSIGGLGPRTWQTRRESAMSRIFSEVDHHSSDRHATVDMQQASDLVDLISRSVSRDNALVHRSLSKLTRLLETLARTLQNFEEQTRDLRRSNDLLATRKEEIEAELFRAQEVFEDVRDLSSERDEARRRADTLEQEVQELKDHWDSTSHEMAKLKAKSAEIEKERLDTQRRDWQWRDRCEQLEHAVENAEGQAKWLRSEVERLTTQLGEADAGQVEVKPDQAEITRLQKQLRSARSALRSYSGAALEGEACAEQLRQQLRQQLLSTENSAASRGKGTTDPPQIAQSRPSVVARKSAMLSKAIEGGNSDELKALEHVDVKALERQIQSQQKELERLRGARDDLAVAKETLDAALAASDRDHDEDLSPEQLQVWQRCKFNQAQVGVLLKHCHELERLVDSSRDTQLGPTQSPDAKRRLSIQRVQEEGMAVFNEMSEQLYTLQVQKADADQELRRLLAHSQEQETQLQAAQQRQNELMAELGRRGCGSDVATTAETRSMGSLCSPTATTATSQSTGSNVDAFLTRATAHLKPSPKTTVSNVIRVGITTKDWLGKVREPSASGRARDPFAAEKLGFVADKSDAKHRERRSESNGKQRRSEHQAKEGSDARHEDDDGRLRKARLRGSTHTVPPPKKSEVKRGDGENCDMQ